MKKLIITSLAVLLAIGLSARKMPDTKVENAKGETVRTSELIDGETPMIVCFWSTTCKPCIQELDAINELLPEWLEQTDLRVVAVSVDDARSSSKARAMAGGHGWDFTLLYDKNQDLRRAMNVSTIPQVFVVDKNGQITYAHNGYTPGSEIVLFEQVIKLKDK